jgi:two-component system response regulator YesN
MISLMIVDDEVNIREGLRDCVDWRAHGIEIACEAEDGRSALAQFDAHNPDIVLTDVVMPGIDGIQVAEEIRRRGADTGIIFLSAHRDIEYLKSALRYEAVDYLLKPVNVTELTTVVQTAAHRIEVRSQREREIRELRDLVRENVSGMKERFYRRLFQGHLSNPVEIRKAAARVGLGDSIAGPHTVAIIEAHATPAGRSSTSLPPASVDSAVRRFVQDSPRRLAGVTIVDDGDGRLILVIRGAEAVDEVSEYLASSLDTLGFRTALGIGSTVADVSRIRESYQTAEIALSRGFFATGSTISRYGPMPKPLAPFDAGRKIESVVGALLERERAATTAAVAALFADAQSQSWSKEALVGVCVDILTRGYEAVARSIDPAQLRSLAPDYRGIFAARSAAELRKQTTDTLDRWVEATADPQDYRNVVQEAMLYIEANYHHDFSVPDVADSVLLSANHLSGVFHDETGMTIREYATDVRMRKAKDLLSTTTYRVSDIAHAVGYQDSNYFSRCFKKHYGMSPGAFRESR